MIEHLKDGCALPLSELKTSGTNPDSKASSFVDGSTISISDYTALEMSLETAQREKNDARREVDLLAKKIVKLERLLESSESKRKVLEDGLEHAEEQLNAIQSQWEDEKQQLMKMAATNTKPTASLAVEFERIRAENEALKLKMKQNAVDFEARELTNRASVKQTEESNTQLQSELKQMEAQLEGVYAKDRKINTLELELMEMKQKLERAEFQVRSLQKDIASRGADLFTEQLKHKKEMNKLELRLLDAEVIRRSLHNQV